MHYLFLESGMLKQMNFQTSSLWHRRGSRKAVHILDNTTLLHTSYTTYTSEGRHEMARVALRSLMTEGAMRHPKGRE